MDEKKMQELLGKVSSGACTVAEALAELKNFPAEMLSCAHLDHHRRLRTGVPEVVYVIRWLAKKHEEGFTHAIGVACEFAVSYALEVIHGQIGLDGLILIINGDKCRTKTDYSESDTADRGRLTFIDEWTLMALDEIVKEVMSNNHLSAKDVVSNSAEK